MDGWLARQVDVLSSRCMQLTQEQWFPQLAISQITACQLFFDKLIKLKFYYGIATLKYNINCPALCLHFVAMSQKTEIKTHSLQICLLLKYSLYMYTTPPWNYNHSSFVLVVACQKTGINNKLINYNDTDNIYLLLLSTFLEHSAIIYTTLYVYDCI